MFRRTIEDQHEIRDARLKAVVATLPSLLTTARRPNTVRKYSGGWLRWTRWAKNYPEVDVFPAKPLHLAAYLSVVSKEANSPGPVETAFYSMKFAHNLLGADNPADHPLPKMVLESAQRNLSKPRTSKKPADADMIRKLHRNYGSPEASIAQLRFITMCVLSFTEFLRFSEVSNIRRCDVTISKDYMKIFIKQSKTDIYRSGRSVFIAATRREVCPVSLTTRYLKMTGLDLSRSSTYYIFRNVQT